MKKAKSQVGLLEQTSLIKKLTNVPVKPKANLKAHISRRLALKHNSKQNTYKNKIIDTLLYNKNTHLSVQFKDDILFEFSDEYLKRNIKINSIIQSYSDEIAELYYNKIYSKKDKKDKKNSSYLFDTKIKEEIDKVMLTVMTSDNQHTDIQEDNSIFNDEFFIYKPEKKRYVNENPHNETSMLSYSKNQTLGGNNLLTVASKDEDMIDIVSNMTKHPLNDKIYDKIQQKSTKKIGKETYNFSTTDKSKGDSRNLNNNLNSKEVFQMKDFRDSLYKKEKDSDMMILEEDYLVTPNSNPILHNSQKTTKTKNENSKQASYKYKPNNARQNSLEKGLKKSLELVDVISNQNQQINSKLKLVLEANQAYPYYAKSPAIPEAFNYNTLDSHRYAADKCINYGPTGHAQNRPSGSGTKFSNLLNIGGGSTPSQNIYNQQYEKTLSKNAKNLSTRIPIKAIKSIEINKYTADLKSPYANMNFNYDCNSRINEADPTPTSIKSKHHKPTLSVQVDKVMRPSQSTVNNLLTFEKMSQLSQLSRVKSNDKLYYKDDENSNDGNNNMSSNVQNHFSYSKKSNMVTGADDSNRIPSVTTTKTATNTNLKIKFQMPERSPSNLTNTYNKLTYIKDRKTKIPSSQYTLKIIGNTLVRGGSLKPDNATEREKSSNKKMKSTDLYYNNYLNNKIQTTRSTSHLGLDKR